MLFTHSASFASPAPSGGLSSASSASTSPPSSRSSRLRRFSHLRSYNPSHLLSRDTSGSSTTSTSSGGDGLTRSVSEHHSAVPRSPLAASHIASSTIEPTRGRNRLTLVTSAPSPSRANHAAAAQSPRTAATVSNNTNNTNTSATNSPLAVSAEPASPTPLAENTAAENSAPAATSDSSSTNERSSSAPRQPTQQEPANMTRTRASTTGDAVPAAASATSATTTADFLPSIRLSAFYDPHSTRPSLTFPPISRTLPTGTECIRVGRYSERDSQSMANAPNNQPSAAPVGFKSKVVSRRHCEFWYENGKWYIKDVKSSSGTFLNHIRLSPPSQESKAFPVNDGDIIQLGIDFKGGEEMIFRCVKMRVELNRGWQNKLNSFNMAAHERLRTMTSKAGPAGRSSSTSQDCSICLNSISPCQSLFVAPCSHTWHFKCVRALLTSPQYPIFICPNCRAGADLEADIDDHVEDWEQVEADGQNGDKSSVNGAPLVPSAPSAQAQPEGSLVHDATMMDVTIALNPPDSPGDRGNLPHATSEPLPIVNPASGSGHASTRDQLTPSPPINGHEGPITPRNDAGPWVFDGSAGQRRAADEAGPGMRSLAAAAHPDANGDSGGR
ncbi:E3 ubiquitin-protein ligase-like protein [Hapsidospora chrysogenum ATCC 11550]|uniref:RING-type E3 ubiquitin transferase n=1 Tax=Hapsidospora chrysogenum (strain ATCC 11550 / CBS 779.69 / DSM 880 / IAM 14645 / JCM 23072 / IMI 49137) TaxID=857340 RepID=A0A086SX15_HAPC1|nr:E3 ubiquitin-protein ligase-like protein [Hapsidospora chrysogenum ATCC 11550]